MEGEAEATATDLKSLMEEEKEKRRQTMLLNIGARSKFSGSFTRVTMVKAFHVVVDLFRYSLLTSSIGFIYRMVPKF